MAQVAPFLNSRGSSAVASHGEVPGPPDPAPGNSLKPISKGSPRSSKGQGRLWPWLGDQIHNHQKRPDKACKRALCSSPSLEN